MSEKTIIIIGGGIAGLSAGCYARMNGFKTKIFEMHDIPGGLCTSWERKGYIFDGCIHYLFGSGAGQPFSDMWHELGATQGRKMVNHPEYQRISDGDQTLIVYADPDQLEDHLCQLSPVDAKLAHGFCEGVRKFKNFDASTMYSTPKPLMNIFDWQKYGMKMMPYMVPMLQWGLVSSREFSERFHNPFLRRAIPHMLSWEEAPIMMGMMLLAYLHNGNAGYPLGGSLAFARAIEQRYLELGGEIYYKSQVEKILVKDNRVIGVRLYSDEIITADYVISACDGYSTLYDMLGEAYISPYFKRLYNRDLSIHSMVQVSLGINRDLSHEPHWTTYLLKKPIILAGEERYEIGVKHYCFDPTLAPEGRSIIELIIRTNYAYWQHIYGRRLYDSEQNQVSDIVIDQLEKWYPGIHQDIEFIDEATPLSYERYTGNWKGSTCGWLLTKQSMPMLIMGVPKSLPNLKNFYMAGQWVEPGGGVFLAAASGRCAVQLICHQEKLLFITSEP